jgi:hypothetical protein
MNPAVVDDGAMKSIAVTMFSIGVAFLITSPVTWLMSRIWGVNARHDPVFVHHKAGAERWVVPLVLAGLIALAVSGVALLLAVATD